MITEYYSIGLSGTDWMCTKSASGADFDGAVKEARQLSIDEGARFTVRYHGPACTKLVCTLDKGELEWPSMADAAMPEPSSTPRVPVADLDDPEIGG